MAIDKMNRAIMEKLDRILVLLEGKAAQETDGDDGKAAPKAKAADKK